MKLPDFIIIGAMKGGTTALMHNLFAHPGVNGPAVYTESREVHYFDQLMEAGVTVQQYAELFFGNCAGEKTPAYLFFPQCPVRMARFVPQAKLITILRNPVDRAYSNHRWCLKYGHTGQQNFEQWLKAEMEREALLQNNPLDHQIFRPIAGSLNLGFHRGLYAEQLERFFRFYKRDQVHIMIAERYRADPARHMELLYEFLELPTWHPSEGYVDEHSSYEPMQQRTRAELLERYRRHNERLFELLGYEIEEWAA